MPEPMPEIDDLIRVFQAGHGGPWPWPQSQVDMEAGCRALLRTYWIVPRLPWAPVRREEPSR